MADGAPECSTRRNMRSALAVRTVPCTRTDESRVCQVFRHLSEYNRVLWHLGVQLRELDAADVGNLQLVSIREIQWASPGNRRLAEFQLIAGDLLDFLLNSHKCIAGIELDCFIASNVSLLKAVRKSPSLRRVRVHGELIFQERLLENMCNTMRSLNKIEHLELCTPSAYPLNYILFSVVGLLRPGARLTSLDVTQLQVNNMYTKMLVDALFQNATITNLAIGACIFSSGTQGSAHKFAEYLAKEKPTLRKLTVRAHHSVDRVGLKLVVRAIPHASVLEELIADLRLMEPEEMAFFAEAIEQSHSVRSLTVRRSNCCERFMTAYLDQLMLRRSRTSAMLPWLSALSKNSTLSELAMDLQGFGVSECCEFFCAVAASNTLQRVIVRNITVEKDLREIFSKADISRLSRKVVIDDLHVRPLNIPALPECVLVTTVTLSYNHIETVDELRSALGVLMNCPHITSLGVHTLSDMYDDNVHKDIAAYIRTASRLKIFDLRLPVGFHMYAARPRSESPLIKALASNTNLQKISLRMSLSRKDCHTLALAALRIPTLSELSLVSCGYGFSESFIPWFVHGMTSNFNLLHVELPDCGGYDAEKIIVQDVTRRNRSLVSRAARFVMGERDPFCACALEPVYGHPKLIDLVEAKTGVDTTEAIAMMKRALSSIQGLDEYMRLSGVVKHNVQCLGRRDGGTQLVDLNEYCWLHIRNYLTLEDVVET
ncbi:hypothetical protein HPB50_024577 [Hyalomma asiaticum]|uniref:Uncharacterized protein n=1 Tax=Hyalomma asiaticum TaxID=266040 RepID=A0ACB7T225_HYAAI|nr:hypothetical protein HPB50_024577 [Hyalomma asiaticum]